MFIYVESEPGGRLSVFEPINSTGVSNTVLQRLCDMAATLGTPAEQLCPRQEPEQINDAQFDYGAGSN